jgi:hypothetical protein
MMKWHKRLLVTAWFGWESLFHILFKVKPIDSDNPLLYSRECAYRGKTMILEDGEHLSPGDRVIELHFNNRALFQIVTEADSMVQVAVGMIRGVRQTLPILAQQMSSYSDASRIKAVYGITFIHRGTKQLGFTVAHLQPGVFAYVTKVYLRVLLAVIHPDGKQLVGLKRASLSPMIVAISSTELNKRYWNGQ